MITEIFNGVFVSIAKKPAAYWINASQLLPQRIPYQKCVGLFVVTDGINIELQYYYNFKSKKQTLIGWDCEIDRQNPLSKNRCKVQEVKYWFDYKECMLPL